VTAHHRHGDCGSGVTSSDSASSAARPDGLVEVHTITYRSSFDGSHVPALLAIPRGVSSRGCVIWQGGFGSTKEDSSQIWQRLAALGLATLSIDLRRHGARGSSSAELERVSRDPTLYAEVIRGTVSDLRSAIDYLETQPYCFRNVASAGVSLGGAVATILTATDDRIKAALIMSTPASWREVLTHARIPQCPERTLDPAALAPALKILSPLDPARFIGRIAPRPVLILSGLEDEIVVMSTARALQTAARRPKTIVNYSGGHDPFSGPVGTGNAEAIASFLLRNVVEPTYGVSGNADGTFYVPGAHRRDAG
jgi:cephalosporin-C deacetylase-like acetyl esterase